MLFRGCKTTCIFQLDYKVLDYKMINIRISHFYVRYIYTFKVLFLKEATFFFLIQAFEQVFG